MKQLTASQAGILLLIYSSTAFAYAVKTHQDISEQAVTNSVLSTDPQVLSNLGLEPLSAKPEFPNSTGESHIIVNLVRDGAGFEDDFPGSRFFHHFYDPIHNSPLTDYTLADQLGSSLLFGGWLADPYKSPDWALEDISEIGVQEFSFKEARRYLFDALTLTNMEARHNRFGLTFQTLGHVIHHLQDMAQPQHTRNEKHPLLPRAWYEQYTENHSAPPLTGYDPVHFDSARKFWVGDGKGIAEFTNRNFVTEGTNFRGTLEHFEPHPDFPSPNGENATIEVEEVGNPELGQLDLPVDSPFLALDTRPLDGKLYFIGTPVVDAYRGMTEANPRTSTFSLYDTYLEDYKFRICGTTGNLCAEAKPVFTLNHFNFDAAHQYLLPRAVSYSAGLIDYFFRGQMEFCDSDDSGISIIKNTNHTEDMKGTFILYGEDDQGVREELARWRTRDHLPPEVEGILEKNGAEMRVAFNSPTPKPVAYMLVFVGDLGEEKAVFDAQGNVLAPGAVIAKRLDPNRHCKSQLWVWTGFNGTAITELNLPAGTPTGSFSPAPLSGYGGQGLAYDPVDGNLWYTTLSSGESISDGKLHKVQPDGSSLPIAITLTGTQLRADGSPDQAVGSIAMDPLDPSYLWVIGQFAESGVTPNYVYKVRIRDGNGELAGQVVTTCSLAFNFSTADSNGTALTTTVIEGQTHLVVVVSNDPQYIVVVKPGENPNACSGRATYNPFFDPATGEVSGALLSVEASGKELLAAVLKPDSTVALYSLGPVRLGSPSVVPVTELFLLPEGAFGDLAMGSNFPLAP